MHGISCAKLGDQYQIACRHVGTLMGNSTEKLRDRLCELDISSARCAMLPETLRSVLNSLLGLGGRG